MLKQDHQQLETMYLRRLYGTCTGNYNFLGYLKLLKSVPRNSWYILSLQNDL